MNLTQLQSFIALVETGSFTEAAEAVHLTQSAVSRALAALERELGVRLLERNRKGVVALTAVGRNILPHARALLAQAEAIEQEARAAQGSTAGKVRLGSIPSLIPPRVLTALLTRVQRLYPMLEVVLFEGAMHEVAAWIEDGVVDVGFVVLPAPGLYTEPVLKDELCVVVPVGHRLCDAGAVRPEDLRDEDFIMEKTRCALGLLARAGFGLRRTPPRIRYQASDGTTILAMVQEGLGITLAPRRMLRPRPRGVAALALDPPQRLEVGLGLRSYDAAPRVVKLFVEVAREWAARVTAAG